MSKRKTQAEARAEAENTEKKQESAKSLDSFSLTIQKFLDTRAAADPVFAERLKAPSKTLKGCVAYIIETVRKTGRIGFTDDEIYGMAAHYYDETDLPEAKAPGTVKVVVNHVVEPTEADKEAARKAAQQQLIEEERKRLLQRKPAAKPAQPVVTASLFDVWSRKPPCKSMPRPFRPA